MYCCSFGGISSAVTPTTVSRMRVNAPFQWGLSNSQTRCRICPRCKHRGQDSSFVLSRRWHVGHFGGSNGSSLDSNAASREAALSSSSCVASADKSIQRETLWKRCDSAFEKRRRSVHSPSIFSRSSPEPTPELVRAASTDDRSTKRTSRGRLPLESTTERWSSVATSHCLRDSASSDTSVSTASNTGRWLSPAAFRQSCTSAGTSSCQTQIRLRRFVRVARGTSCRHGDSGSKRNRLRGLAATHAELARGPLAAVFYIRNASMVTIGVRSAIRLVGAIVRFAANQVPADA